MFGISTGCTAVQVPAHYCHVDSCCVVAFDDELIDDGNIDWEWNKDDGAGECSVGPVDVKPIATQAGSEAQGAKQQRTTTASTSTSADDHSDVLSRIHAAIQSLIAGEKIVQQTKAATLTRLADTLANYDNMVDDVIRCIGDTRVRVKDEIRGVYECALKRLDGQIDELGVSIGQLQGLAELARASTDKREMLSKCTLSALVTRFGAPVCTVFAELPVQSEITDALPAMIRCNTRVIEAKSVEGQHKASLNTRRECGNSGLAVNNDATLMAVCTRTNNGSYYSRKPDVCDITLYQLPSGEELRTLERFWPGDGQFCHLNGVCFTVDNTLLVADSGYGDILDMTVMGECKRVIRCGMGEVVCLGANETMVVSCKKVRYTRSIVVNDYFSGAVVRKFGENGDMPGQLSTPCCMSITPDNYIIIADRSLSMFTATGVFVRDIFDPVKDGAMASFCFGSNGDIIAAGYNTCDIIVFSPDGSRVVKRFGSLGLVAPGKTVFRPFAVAFAQGRLYVLEGFYPERVQVFE